MFWVVTNENYITTFVLRIKDPVLPMILSGLTMNFMLYEKDYGLAIARLYRRFNLQMKVVKSSLRTQTKELPKSNLRIREAFLLRAIYVPIFCGQSVLFIVTVMFCWFVRRQQMIESTGSLSNL